MAIHNAETSRPSISIALSGGGHRASLFGLGALMYVVDAGRAKDVTSIASVSGGSLTNGVIAQSLDFQATDSSSFENEVVRPLASRIANRGTVFSAAITRAYIGVLLAGLVIVLAPFVMLERSVGDRLAVSLLLIAIWGWPFGLRSRICSLAFRTTLFAPGGRTTLLRNIKKRVTHVFCATELRTAQSLYFSGDFVYAHAMGVGIPDDIPLHEAVQASANFPGGFPPLRLPASRHQFNGTPDLTHPDESVRELVLSDGGVYDNMADQWALGFSNRTRLRTAIPDLKAPRQLVVVNASARVPWLPVRFLRIPWIGEISGFFRTVGVLYVNTTNVRRQVIVASYDPRHPKDAGKVPGVLIQITQSPFQVANSFADECVPEVRARAEAVIAALDPATESAWNQIAAQNAAVGTTLFKLGQDVSARLLYHGYMTAMCNLHVIYGDTGTELGCWPLHLVPDLRRFEELVAQQ
ncbi:MAG: patatin-like phospholipase family protein [Gemmatimonadales bacterium]